MLDLVDSSKVPTHEGAPVVDKAVWQAWMAKSALREQHSAARRVVAIKFLTIGILVATALLWTHTSGYDLWIRFAVALGGMVVLFQAVRRRRYALAAVFATLIVIYNPIVPTFPFAGAAPLSLVLLTTLPFAASLIWLRPAA